MAISAMIKVLIIGHLSEFDKFIRELQYASIIHLIDISESSEKTNNQYYKNINPDTFQQLQEIYKFLENYKEKESFLKKLLTPPKIINKNYYENIASTFDPQAFIDSAQNIKNQINSLTQERENLLEQKHNLLPWKDIKIPMKETGTSANTKIALGTIDNNKIDLITNIENSDVITLKKSQDQSIILVAAHTSSASKVFEILTLNNFQEIDISETEISPFEKFKQTSKRIIDIDSELNNLSKEISKLLKNADKLNILLEYYQNIENRQTAVSNLTSTESAFVIEGWIKKENLAKLKSIISSHETILFEEMEISKDDSPPITFKNRKLFAPFQILTKLYSFPSYNAVDPSPVLSIFFVLFFGITLTDAGYGLILAIIALIGMWKIKGNKDVLWIIFWGGIFTIFAGLLTGGIFGDLFRQKNPFLNIPILTSFRESVIWFDPMMEPMTFFRLVLLLGLIHIITGIIMGIISNIKNNQIFDAIVDNLSWLTIIVSLLCILFASNACIEMSLISASTPPLSKSVILPSYILLGLMACIIILFGARDEKSLFFRFFIGFLKLVVLSGMFSYLGDVLSYIRLMALGMVTAGIGMAVNEIAFLMYDVPVAGVVLTGVVLIFGHLFNLVINLLGGFVHTLRLQYVEFFSKFFIGGGNAFIPLSNSNKYIQIIE